MPRTVEYFQIHPPLGGLNRRFSYQNQAPFTTPGALNVLPFDPLAGRNRMATRPGITATGATISTPYNWCEATYVNSGTKRAVAITTSTGTHISTDGATFTEFITTNPGTDFASCAVYQQTLYQAAGGAETRSLTLTGSAGAGSTLTSIDTAGTAPTNCGIVQTCMSRLWLAGDTSNPHKIYSPRQGTPTDWDYAPAQADQGMAWQSGGSNQQIFEPITSLIDHGTNCLIVGCQDSMYVVSGNPTAGGQVYQTGAMVGPLMQSAWCKDMRNNTWMLTRAGLCMIPSGCPDRNFTPTMVSAESLPHDLLAIRPEAGDHVSVACDIRWQGLHVYVDYASGTDAAYFYDFRAGGFWPMSFATGTMRLGAVLKGASTSTKSSLLMLKDDGTVYQFDSGSSESVDSYLLYGPIPLAPEGHEGRLADIMAVLSDNSGSVAPTIYTGDSEQETVIAAIAGSAPSVTLGNWTRDTSPLRQSQYWQQPMSSGQCFVLRVDDVSSADWGIEKIEAGRQRLMGRVRPGVA
jgi:hypothetical protein